MSSTGDAEPGDAPAELQLEKGGESMRLLPDGNDLRATEQRAVDQRRLISGQDGDERRRQLQQQQQQQQVVASCVADAKSKSAPAQHAEANNNSIASLEPDDTDVTGKWRGQSPDGGRDRDGSRRAKGAECAPGVVAAPATTAATARAGKSDDERAKMSRASLRGSACSPKQQAHAAAPSAANNSATLICSERRQQHFSTNGADQGQHTVIELSDSNQQASKKSTTTTTTKRTSSANNSIRLLNNSNNTNSGESTASNNKSDTKRALNNNCLTATTSCAPAVSKTTSSNSSNSSSSSSSTSVCQLPSKAGLNSSYQTKLVTRQEAATDRQHQQQQQLSPLNSTDAELELHKRTRRLTCLQGLVLRHWPYSALAVCIMGSLIFGVLLSALSVYLMHSLVADQCGGVGAARPLSEPIVAVHELLGSARTGSVGAEPYANLADSAANEPPLIGQSGAAAGKGEPSYAGRSHLASALDEQSKQQQHQFQRLPSTLFPDHYELFIWPHLDRFTFDGRVSILIDCRAKAQNITLHASELSVDQASVKLRELSTADNTDNNKLAELKVRRVRQEAHLQYLIVELDESLEPGKKYEVSMDFAGKLNDDLAGFYKIKYERANSTEPTSADGQWVIDSFAKSQRMSTYLVAFAVTNFESRSDGNISVWTRPGFTHTAEYALKIAGKILRHYERFFGIEYPLPKMDMIALPDFNAGAMENWGLITYRETAMLYDESSSSVANKQRVAVVVAHELAHQWFGNLVTPKWWDDLWLNEGFASFVEYIGVDHVEPKWRMLDQFVVEEIQNVFKVDSLSSSHQISIPVNNPDEINEIFDHISYAKGASIIRMMSHFLTEDVLKLGLQSYLRALKYSNAEQSDLWAHLTDALRSSLAGTQSPSSEPVNVERVMNSWTLQTGYPLVTLTRFYNSTSGSSPGAKLEQVRYQPYRLQQSDSAASGNKTAMQQQQQRWEIPITYTWRSEQDWTARTRLWLHQNSSGSVELPSQMLPSNYNDWMLLNVKQVGYYRVNYDLQNWRLLIKQLNDDYEQIGVTNRAQLLDDMFELAKSSLLDYNLAMEATRYLKSEREYLPWDTVLVAFAYIDDMLQRTPIYGDWREYTAELIGPYYARYSHIELTSPAKSLNDSKTVSAADPGTELKPPLQPLGIDSNDVLEQYSMVNAIAWACQLNEHCIKRAKGAFKNWRTSQHNNISPALRYTVYCTAIENGDKDDWEFLWRAYEREQNASERDRIMRALSCSKEMWILSRYLEWIFDKNKPIRRQDGAYVFRMIAKNNYGRDIAFSFMRERWATIKEFYGKTSFSLGNLIRSISTSMNTQSELNLLQNFYETIKTDVGSGKRSFQNAIEEVESNVNWRNKNYKLIEDWLQKNKQSRPVTKAT